jgi:glutathione-regulated potassium-efflux system ancillary protein KefC
MAPHQGDVNKLIAVATQGRRELEALWSREREERRSQKARRGDGFHADKHPRDDSGPPSA